MGGFRGTIPDLAAIRKRRGVSLQQIARSTKISVSQLQAIENGQIQKLPGAVYTRSYIRQYARAIDYDEHELLDHYGALAVDPLPDMQDARPAGLLARLARFLTLKRHLDDAAAGPTPERLNSAGPKPIRAKMFVWAGLSALGDSEIPMDPGGTAGRDFDVPAIPPEIAAAAGDGVDAARRDAVHVLRECSHASGMNASAGKYGHAQVWARDSMIALLGGCASDDAQVHAALRASIATLAEHQAASGCIPNNVDPVSGKPNFRAYADGGLWFVIGSSLLAPDYARIRRVLDWYECQDVDQSGLISMQESSDWQDLFCTRGQGLYVNCLYVLALRRAAEVARRSGDEMAAARYSERAQQATAQINERFWYRGDRQTLRHVSHSFSTANLPHDSLGRKRWLPSKRVLEDESYYLPYLGFRAIGEWFDSLGNLMAIIAGVASAQQANTILDFVERHDLSGLPLRAIYPPVTPGDPDWREYFGELNQPHCYHNGGVWPFIGGFHVAALVAAGRQDAASAALHRLALLNRQGRFNEWHHGITGEPMGVPGQAWSAGMYLYAYECVRLGRVALL